MSGPFVFDEFAPIAWRVWWQHHNARLNGKGRQPEFLDFKTMEEAEASKRSMQAAHPHSVICVEPQHLKRPKREARYEARQQSVAIDWPMQRKPPAAV
jgi:hypothetical protein